MNEVIMALEKALHEIKTALALKPLNDMQVYNLDLVKTSLEDDIKRLKANQ